MKVRVKRRKVFKEKEPERNQTDLKKIISGGQIGIDIAALRAAKRIGFRTGGHMPEGFISLDGCKPGYEWKYGIKDDSYNYKERTWRNVRSSDATIRLATDFSSKGEICTLNAVRYYKKPLLDLYMESQWLLSPEEVAHWIISNKIKVLNIAGNADSSLEYKAELYLAKVFSIILWR